MFQKTNQSTQMVKNERFLNFDTTKQCASFWHTNPLTKRQRYKTRTGVNTYMNVTVEDRSIPTIRTLFCLVDGNESVHF